MKRNDFGPRVLVEVNTVSLEGAWNSDAPSSVSNDTEGGVVVM